MDKINDTLAGLNFAQIGLVVPDFDDQPIARMVFFDTYQNLGLATEIMSITPEG